MTPDQQATINHKIAELRRKEAISKELMQLMIEIVLEQLTINDSRRETLLFYMTKLKEK